MVLAAFIFKLTFDLGSKSEVKFQNLGAFLYRTFYTKSNGTVRFPIQFCTRVSTFKSVAIDLGSISEVKVQLEESFPNRPFLA